MSQSKWRSSGFTFGKSVSAYATPWHGYPRNNTSNLIGGHDTVTGVNNIQYTAQFGNGVSGAIGLDDPTVFNRTWLYSLSTGIGAGGFGTTAYSGFVAPDLVANVRVDQVWALFQLSGALHDVDGTCNTLGTGNVLTTASVPSDHPNSKLGGSAMAALQINNIPTGAGRKDRASGIISRSSIGLIQSISSASDMRRDDHLQNGSVMGLAVTQNLYEIYSTAPRCRSASICSRVPPPNRAR